MKKLILILVLLAGSVAMAQDSAPSLTDSQKLALTLLQRDTNGLQAQLLEMTLRYQELQKQLEAKNAELQKAVAAVKPVDGFTFNAATLAYVKNESASAK